MEEKDEQNEITTTEEEILNSKFDNQDQPIEVEGTGQEEEMVDEEMVDEEEEEELEVQAVHPDYLTYQKVVDDQSEEAEQYHSKTVKLDFISKLFGPTVLFLLVLVKFPNWLRDISPFGQGYNVLTIAFIVIILHITQTLVGLPLDWWSEQIEREFDFATRTTKEWAIDQLKSFGIGLLIFLVIIEALYAAIFFQPSIWWVYGFLGYFIFAGILQSLSPYLISIFTTIKPFPKGEIRTAVEEVAQEMNLEYEDIYLWKLSEQTRKANAAVMGLFKTTRIVLSDNLVNNFRPDEIKVVMRHEIAHQQKNDVYRQVLFTGVISLIAFYLVDLGFETAINLFDFTGKSDPASIGYFLFAISLIFLLLSWLSLYYTRKREKAADLVAIREDPDMEKFESAFARLSKQNLSYPNPSTLEIWLRYTHPPIRERVKYARDYVKNQH